MNKQQTPCTVRFAPSPTGHLHIGGVRTALFNYLFARQNNGQFLVRIEDTDRERSTQENKLEILSALAWLGLSPDEEPVIQSRHLSEHLFAAQKLVDQGKAYRCFCSPEKIEADKKKAAEENRPYRYSGRCRHLCKETIQQYLNEKRPFTIRFKVPGGITRFKDMVYKKIEVDNSEIDDFIIVRSNNSPIYQLSVVIDDAAMGITHVIRGEDHLSNTPKQILLYLALGYKVPKFAHLPLILGPEGKRLSKRHGATSMDEFIDMGFLPDALLNGLALLGWGDNVPKPIFTRKQLIESFDLKKVSKKGAIFDLDKLFWINGQHLSMMSADQIWPRVKTRWLNSGLIEPEFSDETGIKFTDLLKTRIRSLNDFVKFGEYLFKSPEKYDKKALEKHFDHEAAKRLRDLAEAFSSLENFHSKTAENALRKLAEAKENKAADYIHPLRLAVTGYGVSPDIFRILEYIGKKRSIARLARASEFCRKMYN